MEKVQAMVVFDGISNKTNNKMWFPSFPIFAIFLSK
jgi:hypothetical protein